MTTIINKKKNNFVSTQQEFLSLKSKMIFILNFFGALFIAFLLILALIYVGLLGEIASNGIFFL